MAEPSSSWKSEPFVWMLIFFPMLAVVAGIITLMLAIRSDTGLVVDDYYKQGKEINRVLARDHAARSLGLTATIALKPDAVEVNVASVASIELPETLRLGIYHKTQPGKDQIITLNRVSPGAYRADSAGMPQGRWNVHLDTEIWRLLGSMQTPADQPVTLSPSER